MSLYSINRTTSSRAWGGARYRDARSRPAQPGFDLDFFYFVVSTHTHTARAKDPRSTTGAAARSLKAWGHPWLYSLLCASLFLTAPISAPVSAPLAIGSGFFQHDWFSRRRLVTTETQMLLFVSPSHWKRLGEARGHSFRDLCEVGPPSHSKY